MSPESTTTTEPKPRKGSRNPYTITPEEGYNFNEGKTVPFKGWRVTFNAPRGEQKVSVILYEESLTHALLDSVLKSHNAGNGAK